VQQLIGQVVEAMRQLKVAGIKRQVGKSLNTVQRHLITNIKGTTNIRLSVTNESDNLPGLLSFQIKTKEGAGFCIKGDLSGKNM
jgi:hypothetical protein